MALSFGAGLRIGNSDPIDDRLMYETVEAVFLPAAQGGIAASRRFDGLQIYISSEQKFYRFIGGTAREHFVPDPAIGSGGGGGGGSSIPEPAANGVQHARLVQPGETAGEWVQVDPSLAIPDEYWFDSPTDRDDYFESMAIEKQTGVRVAIKVDPPTDPATYYISEYSVVCGEIWDDEDQMMVPHPETRWVDKVVLGRGAKGDTGREGMINEPPHDDKLYARSRSSDVNVDNGEWVEVPGAELIFDAYGNFPKVNGLDEVPQADYDPNNPAEGQPRTDRLYLARDTRKAYVWDVEPDDNGGALVWRYIPTGRDIFPDPPNDGERYTRVRDFADKMGEGGWAKADTLTYTPEFETVHHPEEDDGHGNITPPYDEEVELPYGTLTHNLSEAGIYTDRKVDSLVEGKNIVSVVEGNLIKVASEDDGKILLKIAAIPPPGKNYLTQDDDGDLQVKIDPFEDFVDAEFDGNRLLRNPENGKLRVPPGVVDPNTLVDGVTTQVVDDKIAVLPGGVVAAVQDNLIEVEPNTGKLVALQRAVPASEYMSEADYNLIQVDANDSKLKVVVDTATVTKMISRDSDNLIVPGTDGGFFAPSIDRDITPGDVWESLTDVSDNETGVLRNTALFQDNKLSDVYTTSAVDGINTALQNSISAQNTTLGSAITAVSSTLAAVESTVNGLTSEWSAETEEDPSTHEVTTVSLANERLGQSVLTVQGTQDTIDEAVATHNANAGAHADIRGVLNSAYTSLAWALDPGTQLPTRNLVFRTHSGTQFVVDMAPAVFNTGYVQNGQLVLVMPSNDEIRINLSEIIPVINGSQSSTIDVQYTNSTITAELINESVTENHLAPALRNKLESVPNTSNFVTTGNAQTISGAKTFTAAVRTSGINPLSGPNQTLNIGDMSSGTINTTAQNVSSEGIVKNQMRGYQVDVTGALVTIDGTGPVGEGNVTIRSRYNQGGGVEVGRIVLDAPDIDMNQSRVTNLGDPVTDNDALSMGWANQNYIRRGESYPLLIQAPNENSARMQSMMYPSNIYWVA